MSPLEKRAEEEISDYMMTHDCNRNPVVFSPASFKKGIEFFKDQAEVKALLKALEFYSKGHHFDWCGKDDFAPENPSGEPINFESGGAEGSEFNLENGGYAREALKAWGEFVGEVK